jgi:type II secretory pathway component PulL
MGRTTYVKHEWLRAWYSALKERLGIAPAKVPDHLAGPLTALARVLD